MIKLLKNVANLNNNFQITVTYQLQFYIINLYKEYSYLILNKLEGLPCFGVMIWQPF